jgi:hypothetical protein
MSELTVFAIVRESVFFVGTFLQTKPLPEILSIAENKASVGEFHFNIISIGYKEDAEGEETIKMVAEDSADREAHIFMMSPQNTAKVEHLANLNLTPERCVAVLGNRDDVSSFKGQIWE